MTIRPKRDAKGLHRCQRGGRIGITGNAAQHVDPAALVRRDRCRGWQPEPFADPPVIRAHFPNTPRIAALAREVSRGSVSPDTARISVIQAISFFVIGWPMIS